MKFTIYEIEEMILKGMFTEDFIKLRSRRKRLLDELDKCECKIELLRGDDAYKESYERAVKRKEKILVLLDKLNNG